MIQLDEDTISAIRAAAPVLLEQSRRSPAYRSYGDGSPLLHIQRGLAGEAIYARYVGCGWAPRVFVEPDDGGIDFVGRTPAGEARIDVKACGPVMDVALWVRDSQAARMVSNFVVLVGVDLWHWHGEVLGWASRDQVRTAPFQ